MSLAAVLEVVMQAFFFAEALQEMQAALAILDAVVPWLVIRAEGKAIGSTEDAVVSSTRAMICGTLSFWNILWSNGGPDEARLGIEATGTGSGACLRRPGRRCKPGHEYPRRGDQSQGTPCDAEGFPDPSQDFR
jgi:hypothetical protein